MPAAVTQPYAAGESNGSCTCKRCLLGCCCCCCCCVIFAPIAGFAIVWAAYEGEPDVGVASVSLTNVALGSDRVTLTLTPEVSITNPNRWPLEAKVMKLTAEVYSLDREAGGEGIGEVLYLGQDSLPAEVMVAAEAETKFEMPFRGDIVLPDSVPFAARLSRDCVPFFSEQRTKLRIVLKDIEAFALGLPLLEIGQLDAIDVEVECQL